MQCRELCSHAAAMQWPPCSSSCCSSSMHADSCMPIHACRFIQSCSSSSSSMHAYMQIENASCKLQVASCNERSRVRIFKICVHYDAATAVHVVQNRGCVHYTRSLEGCSGPSCPKFADDGGSGVLARHSKAQIVVLRGPYVAIAADALGLGDATGARRARAECEACTALHRLFTRTCR